MNAASFSQALTTAHPSDQYSLSKQPCYISVKQLQLYTYMCLYSLHKSVWTTKVHNFCNNYFRYLLNPSMLPTPGSNPPVQKDCWMGLWLRVISQQCTIKVYHCIHLLHGSALRASMSCFHTWNYHRLFKRQAQHKDTITMKSCIDSFRWQCKFEALPTYCRAHSSEVNLLSSQSAERQKVTRHTSSWFIFSFTFHSCYNCSNQWCSFAASWSWWCCCWWCTAWRWTHHWGRLECTTWFRTRNKRQHEVSVFFNTFLLFNY